MALRDLFLSSQGELLRDHGFIPDVGQLERQHDQFIFYHYTHKDKVQCILANGINAYRRVVAPNVPQFQGCHLAEAFLSLQPKWLIESRYFGNLGQEMMAQYIGEIALKITVPTNYPGLYIADYAHMLECKHLSRRGSCPLGIGYDCGTGQEVCQAYVNSYIPVQEYEGGHVAPLVQIVRKGQGIAIPSEFIHAVL